MGKPQGSESPQEKPSGKKKRIEETAKETKISEEQIPQKTIIGKVKDRTTGKPISGTVEAHTELETWKIKSTSKNFQKGKFEIKIPEKGKGESEPIADNSTLEGRAKNK